MKEVILDIEQQNMEIVDVMSKIKETRNQIVVSQNYAKSQVKKEIGGREPNIVANANDAINIDQYEDEDQMDYAFDEERPDWDW